ncbi:kinase-like protein [Pseudovirgaria hyperparasitica]|uniref:Kinase-like protein n=1 Tax=Pseudovirgaria hyperparasitica TaxID=470096 RepID=A0A6A6VZZ0_9PEZI|nr:kinase-like protein [Pseudovirgaria hyperparasitica]KAF2755863.1 kinase-like protein [Pseudovirgaria hyperparasitica]
MLRLVVHQHCVSDNLPCELLGLDHDLEKFYRYTSGRWLWNEHDQLACRYVRFNLPGLLQVSSKAMGGRSCVEIEKLHEGNFNKVFLITFDDGRDLIAKIPNPNAGPPHFTTASEVATMDYIRNILGIPAPQVYGYCSSTDNPVRAEYILMERSKGIELGKIWENMPGKDKFEIVRSLVGYEKAMYSVNSPMYGSLYYAKDLPNLSSGQFLNSTDVVGEVAPFAIGPTTNRAFFDGGRYNVEAKRGPWSSINDFISSRANRELACIEKFSRFPNQQGMFNGPNQYRPTKELKIKVLRDYLKVATQILPKDENLSKPVLWHSDLHADNIFVDPSQPTKILNVIDWQAVNVSPLFLQARHPSLIEFEGPIPEGLKPIELPDDFDKLNEDEQHQAKILRAAQSLYKLYDISMLRQCPDIARALRFRDTLPGQITGIASSIFSDGEPVLQGMLIQLQDEWTTCANSETACPLSYTPDDRAHQQRLQESWNEGVELMYESLTQIGAYQGWNGWVNHSNYSLYKERLARHREDFLRRHAYHDEERSQWMRAWPFKDDVEIPL